MNIKFIYAVLIITIVASLTAHSLVQHAQDLGAKLETQDELVVPKSNSDTKNLSADLIEFSIKSGQKISNAVVFTGKITGGYFFEGNILVNILDADKKLLKAGHADATTDWMTTGPVSFKGFIDVSNIKNGPAFVEIHNDNASGESKNDKSILIPVVIENKK